jgi:hypothetical protein
MERRIVAGEGAGSWDLASRLIGVSPARGRPFGSLEVRGTARDPLLRLRLRRRGGASTVALPDVLL